MQVNVAKSQDSLKNGSMLRRTIRALGQRHPFLTTGAIGLLIAVWPVVYSQLITRAHFEVTRRGSQTGVAAWLIRSQYEMIHDYGLGIAVVLCVFIGGWVVLIGWVIPWVITLQEQTKRDE